MLAVVEDTTRSDVFNYKLPLIFRNPFCPLLVLCTSGSSSSSYSNSFCTPALRRRRASRRVARLLYFAPPYLRKFRCIVCTNAHLPIPTLQQKQLLEGIRINVIPNLVFQNMDVAKASERLLKLAVSFFFHYCKLMFLFIFQLAYLVWFFFFLIFQSSVVILKFWWNMIWCQISMVSFAFVKLII